MQEIVPASSPTYFISSLGVICVIVVGAGIVVAACRNHAMRKVLLVGVAVFVCAMVLFMFLRATCVPNPRHSQELGKT